jgi:hypothetical protein
MPTRLAVLIAVLIITGQLVRADMVWYLVLRHHPGKRQCWWIARFASGVGLHDH